MAHDKLYGDRLVAVQNRDFHDEPRGRAGSRQSARAVLGRAIHVAIAGDAVNNHGTLLGPSKRQASRGPRRRANAPNLPARGRVRRSPVRKGFEFPVISPLAPSNLQLACRELSSRSGPRERSLLGGELALLGPGLGRQLDRVPGRA